MVLFTQLLEQKLVMYSPGDRMNMVSVEQQLARKLRLNTLPVQLILTSTINQTSSRYRLEDSIQVLLTTLADFLCADGMKRDSLVLAHSAMNIRLTT